MTSPTSETLEAATVSSGVAFSLLVTLFPFALFALMLLLPLNSIDLAWPSRLLSLYSVDISFLLLSTLPLLLLRLP